MREKCNWISTFTRVGCLAYKEGGEGTHRGRTGDPMLLVVGDEATPMAVCYTIKEGGGGGFLCLGCKERALKVVVNL
jgi:hypothetical protein